MPMKIVIFSLLAFLVAIFALENSTPVEVRFLGATSLGIPLAAVIIGLFALGITVGVLFSLPKIWQYRGRVRELERELNKYAPKVLVSQEQGEKDAKI